jgi:hypothetical protein
MSFRILKSAAILCLALAAMAPTAAPKPAASPKETAPKSAESGPTADELAKKGLGSSFAGLQQGYAEMRMLITSATGVQKDQTLSFKSMRDSDGMLLYLLRFESPAELAGTSFLVRERKGALPAQYIYLPATKSVQEVAAGKATSSFFGSDFIYADLLPYPTDKKGQVELSRLPDNDNVGGQKCYVLEVKINDEKAPYSKIVASIEKEKMNPLQVEFFDRAGKALKTLKVLKLKKMEGKLVPVEFEMKNLQAGSKTQIFINTIDSKRKFKAEEFTKDALRS